MSYFVPREVISLFAETDSNIGEARSVPLRPPFYSNPLDEMVVEGAPEKIIVPECSQAKSESSDEEEVIDVVGGEPAGVTSGPESEGLTFTDAHRCTIFFETSKLETVVDKPGMPTCNYCFVEKLLMFLCTHIDTLRFMQLVSRAHPIFLCGKSFCYSVQSFRGTRSAPRCFEPCSLFVWVRTWGWWSRFWWRAPVFCVKSRSFHGCFGELVLVCML